MTPIKPWRRFEHSLFKLSAFRTGAAKRLSKDDWHQVHRLTSRQEKSKLGEPCRHIERDGMGAIQTTGARNDKWLGADRLIVKDSRERVMIPSAMI